MEFLRNSLELLVYHTYLYLCEIPLENLFKPENCLYISLEEENFYIKSKQILESASNYDVLEDSAP